MKNSSGITQDSRDFGLPPDEPEDTWENPWWGSTGDYEPEDGGDLAEGDDPPGAERPAEGEAAQVDGDAAEPRGATGSPPSHRNMETTQTPAMPATTAPKAIDEMSVADSFIMGVLRGWRLLQAAGLSAEEKRDILSTTRNSLNYDVISQALQGLWDEQLLGHRHHGGGHMNYMDAMDPAYLNYQEHDEDWDDEWQPWWDDYSAYYQEPEEEWWDGQWDSAETQSIHAMDNPDDEDPRLREAQQAEQVAESLAAEAQRTWTEAQKATAALRKDRGFGAVLQKGGSSKCFVCGGPHFARECPRRMAKGKGKSMYGYYYEDFAFNKGKSKGKGKPRPKGWNRAAVMEAQAQWMKGKGKGKHGGPAKTVNVYAADANYLGDLASASTSVSPSPQEHLGMLDSGATASAAPELVIRGLISSILTMDKNASVNFDASARPYFRFGNGRWGRALSRVSIISSASGNPITFSLYMLPNPPSAVTDASSVPPLLVGMDFINEVGLLVDFKSGLAMNRHEAEPIIYELPRNRKGHLMVDVRQHLTKGMTCDHGHAHVSVCQALPAALPEEEVSWLELGTLWFDLSACDLQFEQQEHEEVESRMWMLFQRAREHDLSTATAATAQMCGASQATLPSTTPSSCSLLDGGIYPSAADGGLGEDCGDQHQGKDEGEGQSTTSRPTSSSPRRCSRPTGFVEDMAMLQPAHCGHPQEQRSRRMGALCSVRSSAGVHPTRRVSWADDQCEESGHGSKDVGRASTADGGLSSDSQHLQGHAGEDRRRGDPPHGDPPAQGGGQHSDYIDLEDDNHAPTDDYLTGQLQRELAGRQRHGTPGSLRSNPASRVKTATSTSSMARPLPHHMGKRVMAFASLMTAATTAVLAGLHLDGRDGVWELSYAPHDWLTQACEREALQPRRFDLQSGYDLYKPETWNQLRRLREVRKPVRVWLSLPCMQWCPWTQLRTTDVQRQRELRRGRRLLRMAADFVMETLQKEPDTEIYWEWTHPNDVTSQASMQELNKFMKENNLP